MCERRDSYAKLSLAGFAEEFLKEPKASWPSGMVRRC